MNASAPSAAVRRPPVFIGSSSEAKKIANKLQVALEHDCDAQVWHQGLFQPGRSYLETLVRALPAYDFAVLLISPDDYVESRGTSEPAPRDNVLFELGLFMGHRFRGNQTHRLRAIAARSRHRARHGCNQDRQRNRSSASASPGDEPQTRSVAAVGDCLR
jgi:hypothetical protein